MPKSLVAPPATATAAGAAAGVVAASCSSLCTVSEALELAHPILSHICLGNPINMCI